MRIVFDTSVLIAAFYKPLYGPSFSKDVYDYVIDHGTAYVSPEILIEFHKTCVQKLKLSTRDTKHLLSLILEKVHLEKLKKSGSALPKDISLRDPTDRHVLELAVTVGAELILSWDKDIVDLQKVKNSPIVTPKKFWESLPRLGEGRM